MLQQTQQKLADRTKALEVKEGELNRLLKEEQEVLYKISELSKDQATEQLRSDWIASYLTKRAR